MGDFLRVIPSWKLLELLVIARERMATYDSMRSFQAARVWEGGDEYAVAWQVAERQLHKLRYALAVRLGDPRAQSAPVCRRCGKELSSKEHLAACLESTNRLSERRRYWRTASPLLAVNSMVFRIQGKHGGWETAQALCMQLGKFLSGDWVTCVTQSTSVHVTKAGKEHEVGVLIDSGEIILPFRLTSVSVTRAQGDTPYVHTFMLRYLWGVDKSEPGLWELLAAHEEAHTEGENLVHPR